MILRALFHNNVNVNIFFCWEKCIYFTLSILKLGCCCGSSPRSSCNDALDSELQMFKPDVEKDRRTGDPKVNIWIIEKQRIQINIDFCFVEYARGFDCIGLSQETGKFT